MTQPLMLTINNVDVAANQFIFSGGEVHVRVPVTHKLPASIQITAHLRSSDDLLGLLLLTDAVRRQGAEQIKLVMPYLPYARQDRVCAPGEALSLRVLCDLINAQRYASVEVWDVHSDVALALLDRVVNVHCSDFLAYVSGAGIGNGTGVLVAPDAGSIKKVAVCASRFGVSYLSAEKVRNVGTGEITATKVNSTEHIGCRNFLIVDDICDGGRTFIELAKKLRRLTDGEVNLYVTHGIFSKGTDVFDGLIDRVFVTNPFPDSLPSNFTHIRAH